MQDVFVCGRFQEHWPTLPLPTSVWAIPNIILKSSASTFLVVGWGIQICVLPSPPWLTPQLTNTEKNKINSVSKYKHKKDSRCERVVCIRLLHKTPLTKHRGFSGVWRYPRHKIMSEKDKWEKTLSIPIVGGRMVKVHRWKKTLHLHTLQKYKWWEIAFIYCRNRKSGADILEKINSGMGTKEEYMFLFLLKKTTSEM